MRTITWAVRAACCLYLALLTTLLLIPDPWAWLLGATPSVSPPDCGVHFCAFFVLAILSAGSRLPWPKLVLAAVLVGYAITTESLQALVETRVVDPIDYTENLLGLAVGAGVWALGQRVFRRSTQ